MKWNVREAKRLIIIKELKEKFDWRFMDVIGKLKKYKEEEQDPSHHEVQVTLKEFFQFNRRGNELS